MSNPESVWDGVLGHAMAPPVPMHGAGDPAFELFGAAQAAGRRSDALAASASGQVQRPLTILFSDLTSSVGLSAELDWQTYVRMLRGLRDVFRATVACHGGTIARMQGDGMLAIFGPPDSEGSAGYHAIRCALDLHRAVFAISPGANGQPCTALHSGIYAGLTYVETGDMERGRYDLVGSAPSLASRLSDLAGRDGILVAEQVIAPRLDDFEVSEPLALAVKGWPNTLCAYRVLGLSHGGMHPQKW